MSLKDPVVGAFVALTARVAIAITATLWIASLLAER